MHNPFLESSAQLRKEWKALRNTLTADLSDQQHLDIVARWWALCPLSKDWFDWDHPDTWPDPWELITTKSLDYSAIALGMEYTLLLSSDGRWTPDRVRLWLASDVKKTFQHLTLAVDDRYILNVAHARVVEISDDLVVHSRYCYDMKHHINS
jgi:hypothetical protein